MQGRLLREVDGSEFFSAEVVATFDEKTNIVRVRQNWWREQHAYVRREVLHTRKSFMLDSDFDHVRPVQIGTRAA